MGDDRTGAVSTGESLLVNPAGIPDLRRMIVYTLIFDGAAAWSSTDAVVTVKVPSQEVRIELGRQTDSRTFCALAELTFSGTSEVDVKKLITFHLGHSDCDRAYGWGMTWKAGSK
jgi:tellurite resistance protein TerA